MRAVVTATNAAGTGKASSAASATIKPVAPVIGVLPVVSGLAVEGQTLSASTGSWSGSPTSYAYQWEGCNTAGEACSNISGGDSASYKLAAGDVGHTLRVVVTATNAGGSGKASSAASAIVTAPPASPANSVLPVVNGSAVEGQTLTASTGTWSGSPTSYSYQWEDCNTAGEACSNITGATSASYKLAAGDVGHTLRVVVTATNAGGSGKASSAASATVVVAAPVNSVLPMVSGSVVQGQTLTTSTGTWSGSPTSYVIPMGGLQHGRRSMFEHHRCDFGQLQARRRRRRTHRACGRHRHQHQRHRESQLGSKPAHHGGRSHAGGLFW